ncbi:choice-of-anchor R domain-containing protein [Prosthecobacter sp.]|uniref:choice-of-anchor R domain-containing protein n=1 Tax=Prosthecobacter sp. TaxID=1965333 RepID=UPI0037835838
MKKSPRSWVLLCSLLLCATGFKHAAASTTYFSTLGQTGDGFAYMEYGGVVDVNATDFLTSASATTITGATFSFSNWDDIAHVMTPKIYTDNAGLPGTLVGTFSTFNVAADPIGPGSGTFRNYSVSSAGINLAANTKYWMAVSVDTATDLPFPVMWNTTATTAMDAGSTFSEVTATQLKYSTDGGSSWINVGNANSNGMFSLSGNLAAAPEPARALFLLAGAGTLLLRRRRRA